MHCTCVVWTRNYALVSGCLGSESEYTTLVFSAFHLPTALHINLIILFSTYFILFHFISILVLPTLSFFFPPNIYLWYYIFFLTVRIYPHPDILPCKRTLKRVMNISGYVWKRDMVIFPYHEGLQPKRTPPSSKLCSVTTHTSKLPKFFLLPNPTFPPKRKTNCRADDSPSSSTHSSIHPRHQMRQPQVTPCYSLSGLCSYSW
jgi:hypothetical protein